MAIILAVLCTNMMDSAAKRLKSCDFERKYKKSINFLELFREKGDLVKVVPLKLKVNEGEIDQASPNYVDKNSTHDNKIFDGNSNSFRQGSDLGMKKGSREMTPPGFLRKTRLVKNLEEVSRKNTISRFIEEPRLTSQNGKL